MNGITRNLKEGLDLNKLHTTGADFELIAQEEPQIKEVDTKEEELYQERVMKYLNPECLDVQEEDRDGDGDANSNMVRVCVCLFVPTADCSKLASVENQQTVTTGHSSKKILLKENTAQFFCSKPHCANISKLSAYFRWQVCCNQLYVWI